MKVSIITATFNSEYTILDCIESVNQQTYTNIEHTIIDGDSHDSTIKIIKNNHSRVKLIISEPEN